MSVQTDDDRDRPRFVITPRPRWRGLDLTEAWTYRNVWCSLVTRDVKIRYKQTVLGGSWAILQPLLAMVIFSIVFGRLARIDSNYIPYPIFVYAGLLPWTFFAATVTGAAQSVVRNAHILTKVYFPRILIPTSVVGYTLLDLALASTVLVALMMYYEVAITWKFTLIPVILAGIILTAVGTGVLISALNVKFRDFQYVVPFLVQIWMFATPVVYPASIFPDRYAWVAGLNPMVGLIEGFRACMLGTPVNYERVVLSSVIGLIVCIAGFIIFRQVEDEFADII